MAQTTQITRKDLSTSQSGSFDLLKKELQEKDEIICLLKKKLEVMESFQCSSSSFDALNSFNPDVRRRSSVIVIGEQSDPIPSPTFKSFSQVASNGLKKLGNFVDRPRLRSHTTNTCLETLVSPDQRDSDLQFNFITRSVALLPSFKQVISQNLSRDEVETIKAEKKTLFRKLFQFLKRFRSEKHESNPVIEASKTSKSNSRELSSDDCVNFLYSYDDIINGEVDVNFVDAHHIEKHLKWEDCINYLGITKEQCRFTRSESLEQRKRSVFLTVEQLKYYPKTSS